VGDETSEKKLGLIESQEKVLGRNVGDRIAEKKWL
jgi:hypothetical protein